LNQSPYLPGATPVGREEPSTTDFSEIVYYLKMQGMPNGHLKAALAILVGMNSANLKNAIAIEIIDNDERNGGKVLDTCLPLVPHTFWVKFPMIPKDIFLRERETLKEKVIIEHDSIGYEKVAGDLNTLLDRQELIFTQTHFGKYGSGPQPITVSGPVGFISIAQDEQSCVLSHPSFLKIRLTSGEPPQDPNLIFDPKGASEMQNKQFKILLQRISSSFERLRPQPVSIPYKDVLLNYLSKTKNGPKGESFLNGLRIITLINNPPKLSKEEQVAKAWGCDIEMIEAATGIKVFPPETLVATKREYYIFWVIYSDLVRNDRVSLNPVQKRIREVVRDRNLKGLGTTWAAGETPAEKLIDISHADSVWASMDDIFKALEKDGGEPVGSTSTVRREVKELVDEGEIQEGKYPAPKNKNGYFVTSFDSEDTVSLPHPSEIEDPFLGKAKIKIQNPITGKIEEV
jgi:hypothetical protein